MNGYRLLAKLISLGLVTLAAIILAAKGHDTGFIFHAYVIAAVALGLFIYYARSSWALKAIHFSQACRMHWSSAGTAITRLDS